MDIRSFQSINTSDNIPLHVELAGIANRVFAFGIDALLLGLLMIFVLFALFLGRIIGIPPAWLRTFAPPLLLALPMAYFLLQEWLWNGKTVGKALLRLRVVRSNGQPIGFWEAFGRNLLRVVDVSLSGIGLPCMMLNRSEKRFGDFLAGTVVILEQATSLPLALPLFPSESASEALPLRLSVEETALLADYRARRTDWLTDSHQQMEQALGRYFTERLGTPVPSDEALDKLI